MAAGLGGWTLFSYFGTRAHMDRLSFGWLVIYLTGSTFFSIVALVNGLGLVGTPKPAPYLTGLGWLLFATTSLFVRLVLAPMPRRT